MTINKSHIDLASKPPAEEIKRLQKTLKDKEWIIEKTDAALKALYKELKQNNDELERIKDSLEVRVQERTKELDTLNKALSTELIERKQAEEALKESEEKYRTLVESSTDAILMMDKEGRVVSCNQAFLDLFGYDKNEVEGKSIRIIHQSEESFRSFGKTAYPMIEKVGYFMGEWEFVRKDGMILPAMETVTSSIKSPDGSAAGYVAIIRNITERKRAEEEKKKLQAQLLQAQKIEAIGTLAGGIAHDFNNLLMAIQGNISLMLFDIEPTHPYYERLKIVEKQVHKGARLTNQLLGYARKGRYEVLPLNLNRLTSPILHLPVLPLTQQQVAVLIAVEGVEDRMLRLKLLLHLLRLPEPVLCFLHSPGLVQCIGKGTGRENAPSAQELPA